ncbi:MAG: hypothetical protein ILP18_04350 [Treponema sp.]|nr:hypothetical protein [Treponema sp.]
MSDFAYAYFSTELDKLSLPDLEQLLEKIQALIAKKLEKKVSKEEAALQAIFARADAEHASSNGEKWTREELYER